MSIRCVGVGATGASALLLAVAAAGCGSSGEPSGGDLWRAHEVQVQARFDTTPPTGEDVPIQVQFDTIRTRWGDPFLWVRVRATNLSDRDLVGMTGAYCNWEFTAFDNAERAGEPVWSDEGTPCRQMGLPLELPAGATQVFPSDLMDIADIMKGRGPGTYYFSARLQGFLGDDPSKWSGGPWLTERIPAGAVVLLQ
jgi:hypothetical protein